MLMLNKVHAKLGKTSISQEHCHYSHIYCCKHNESQMTKPHGTWIGHVIANEILLLITHVSSSSENNPHMMRHALHRVEAKRQFCLQSKWNNFGISMCHCVSHVHIKFFVYKLYIYEHIGCHNDMGSVCQMHWERVTESMEHKTLGGQSEFGTNWGRDGIDTVHAEFIVRKCKTYFLFWLFLNSEITYIFMYI